MNRQRSLFNSFVLIEEFILVLMWPFVLVNFYNTRLLRLIVNILEQAQYITLFALLFVLSGFFFNHYQKPQVRKLIDEIASLWFIQVVHFFMTTFIFIYMNPELSRFSFVIIHGSLFIVLVIHRLWIRWLNVYLFKRDILVENILVINASSHAQQYIETIENNPRFTQKIHEIIPYEDCSLENIASRIKDTQCFHAVISDEGMNQVWLQRALELCDNQGILTTYLPYSQTFMATSDAFDIIGQQRLYPTRAIPLNQFSFRLIKRTLDLLITITGLIVLLPVFVLIATLIKITSPGPIFFVQERMGYQKKPFKCYKFRTMHVSKDQSWIGSHDPRITTIGKWLRFTSLDELPQLYNVLKGEMSCVGPRPERVEFIETLSSSIAKYHIKHTVKPGMTGWAQINGYRGDTSLQKRIEFDLYYLQNWSLGLDIYIILRTALLGFINKGEL
ncbi:MAG: exopolysaccharide biosynthesis polyprenyl glycosylphosphotransferase [Erysipelothrix sp.]|nr:exopolysaccharide biosynthesis polyprenyl glycosylphosphotransferase [Erysipelothrix sp.]